MKKIITFLLALVLTAGIFVQTATAQVTVTGSTGANATYARLGLAFTAINGTAQTGNNIVITITANTTESASAVLNAGAWATLKIYPTVTGLSISGSLAAPLIDLSGADNVTIDGRVNATGATKDLIITNTSTSATAGTSNIRFINDATANTVKYCTIKGSSLDAAGGVLFFSTTTGTTGNDGNTVDNNNITSCSDANRATNSVYSNGTIAKTNSGNTISNNNFYNFISNANLSMGVGLNQYNTGWTISNNSFYETTSWNKTGGNGQLPITVRDVTSSDITISGNYIGGSAPNCGGTAWTKTSASRNIFVGIQLVVGPTVSTPTSVQGNTIKNFNWGDDATGYASWTAIYAGGTGAINIGTVTGNTIGASTGNNSIYLYSGNFSVVSSLFYGIEIGTTGTADCRNNTVGAIYGTSNVANYAFSLYGIHKSAKAGATTISNNTIGSTSTANSFNSGGLSWNYLQQTIGIYSEGTGTVSISGNTIANLNNEGRDGARAHQAIGIQTTNGTNTIANNTVRNLTCAYGNNSANTPTVVGIAQTSTVAAAQSVTGNTIYNLSSTTASFGGAITGIYYAGPATASTVSGNFIHSLSVSSNAAAGAGLYGMYINGGTSIYSNNIINLGNNTSITVNGIMEANGTNNYYFNTVYIGGAPTTGGYASYAARSSISTTRNYRNNLFINARSNNGSTGNHYAAFFNNLTALTLDYNNYIASGTDGLLAYFNGTYCSTLAQVKAAYQNVNSLNTNPAFASAGGTLAANYQVPVASTLPGITIAGQTTDYAGITRAGTPTMGAYEKSLFSQVVTFTAMTAKTYGAADFTPTVTASSGLTTFTYTSSNTAVATVNSSTGLVHIVGAGMANITATQAGNSTWAAASATSSLTVNAKALTLATAAAQNKSYDGTNAAVLTGTLTGVINSDDVTVSKTGTFATINVGTGIAVTSTSTLGGTKAGNYSLTQPTGLTANITGGVQVINFGALAAKTYGDAPFVVSATGGASGNPVTFSSSDPTVASCSGTNGTTVTILKVGSCTIYADQAGNSLYSAATQVPQTLTIAKANQVITLSPLPVGSVALKDFVGAIQVTATSNSGQTVAISLGAGSAATLNVSNQLESVGSTGTVVINLSVDANDNYNAASSSYTFDVVKNNQSITFGALSGVTYSSGLTVPLSGTASASSTLAVSYSVVSGPATITGTTLNISGAGEVVIAASQAGDATWNPATDVTQTLSVSLKAQTISFAALVEKNYGDAAFALSATGDASGNAVTFSSSDPTVATCDGTNNATVTILKAGSCVIYADQAGNSSYSAAPQVSQTLTINKGNQILTLGQLPIGTQPLKDFTDPIQVSASSTSGLAVTISLGSGSAASLNVSNQLENIGTTGTLVINLTQDGDDNYNSATATYTFDVEKSNQSITFDALADMFMGDPDFSPGATASSALTVSYGSSNTAVATIVNSKIHITGVGATFISASQDGDATWNPAANVIHSLTVTAAFKWTGNTSSDWNTASNWNTNEVPGASNDVVVPTGINLEVTATAICNNLTLQPKATLTLTSESLTVGGNLILQSGASGNATLLDNGTLNVVGTSGMEQYLLGNNTAGTLAGRSYYISSPFTAAKSSVFHPNGTTIKMQSYSETSKSFSTITGDDIDLSPMKGYFVRVGTTAIQTFTEGTFNTGTMSDATLTRTAGLKEGFNLVGNPYPSYLDWDKVQPVSTNLETTIWYRTATSNTPGGMRFATYNSSNGQFTNEGVGKIPACQAFWVRVVTGQTTGTILFTNSMRSHEVGGSILKSPGLKKDALRLTIKDTINSDETLILFDENATDEYDVYDSGKMMGANSAQCYTSNKQGDMAINSFAPLSGIKSIPVGVEIINPNSMHTFTVGDLRGFEPGASIILEDKITNVFTDLRTNSSYSFTANTGTDNKRFIVHLGLIISDIKDHSTLLSTIYAYEKTVYINSVSQGRIDVYDINGISIIIQKAKAGMNTININIKGVYLVKLVSENEVKTTKILIK